MYHRQGAAPLNRWSRRSSRISLLGRGGSWTTSETIEEEDEMKLLTALIAADQLQRVAGALDSAGITATTVASAEAPGLKGGASLTHRGSVYRDQRCVRLEMLVSDADVEIAFGLLAPSGGPASDGLIVWSSDVEDLAVPPTPDRVAVVFGG